jgi:energy-coupling factor transporter ATP-binding protein EcfA2
MAMFNEIHNDKQAATWDTEDLTKEDSLKKLLQTMDKEQVLNLEDDFVQAIGEKGIAKKFIKKLVEAYVTAMIETRALTLEKKEEKAEELIQQINTVTPSLPSPTLPITKDFTIMNSMYVTTKYTSNGLVPEVATNFIFDNTRFVAGDRGIITDIIVNGSVLQQNAVFDKQSLSTYEAFRKNLHSEADVLFGNEAFRYFIRSIKEPARSKLRVSLIDKTGLFKDENTGEYFFLIYDNHGQLKKIMKTGSNITSDIYCEGKHAKETLARIKIKSNLERFQEVARTLLNRVSKMIRKNKSTIALAWSFGALLSELFYEYGYYFPLLFLYGDRGSGKSTLSGVLAKMLGYKSTRDKLSYSSTAQPFKQAASSTNAFPVITEEFGVKRGDSFQAQMNFLKELTNRGIIKYGLYANRNAEYPLSAPTVLQGNNYVKNEAVADRCLPIHMDKIDLAMTRQEATDLIRMDMSDFLYPYLQYLIEKQDQWHHWYEHAEEIVGNINRDARTSITAVAVIMGILMMNDLAEHVGADMVTDDIMQEIVNDIVEQRDLSNPKESHVRFLEYVQEHHAEEDISRLKTTLLNGSTIWINKAFWMNKFLEDTKSKGQEIEEASLINNLSEKSYIKGTKSGINKKMYNISARTLEFDIVAMEKDIPSLAAELWNDIRQTNYKVSAEQTAQELKESLNYQAAVHDGEREIMERLKKIKPRLDEAALEALRSVGISLEE